MFKLLLLIAVGSVCGQHGRPGHLLFQHLDYNNSKLFASWLKEIQASRDFATVSADEKVLFAELVMAAEQGSSHLTDLIQRTGFAEVLALAHDMDKDDRDHFERYLTAHLSHKRGLLRKRDLLSSLMELHIMRDITKHLPYEEARIYVEMMQATRTNTLTQYIDSKGYGTILRLFTYLNDHHSYNFDELVIEQLNKEKMAMAMKTDGVTSTTIATST